MPWSFLSLLLPTMREKKLLAVTWVSFMVAVGRMVTVDCMALDFSWRCLWVVIVVVVVLFGSSLLLSGCSDA